MNDPLDDRKSYLTIHPQETKTSESEDTETESDDESLSKDDKPAKAQVHQVKRFQ